MEQDACLAKKKKRCKESNDHKQRKALRRVWGRGAGLDALANLQPNTKYSNQSNKDQSAFQAQTSVMKTDLEFETNPSLCVKEIPRGQTTTVEEENYSAQLRA